MGKKVRYVLFMALFSLMMTAQTVHAESGTGKMIITAIDLGAANTGEATMIESGNGGTPLLVDTGDNHNRSIFTWLDNNGYGSRKFDTVVTHWHDDHAGNTAEIIRRYNVGTAYIPDPSYLYKEESAYYRYERGYYTRLIDAAKARGTKIVYIKKGMTIKAGNDVTGRVIYCCESPRWESSEAVHYINNQSVVIMFEGGGTKFLMAADVEKPAENRILNSGTNIKADIFKMSHHGYETSNQQKFLEAVDPTFAYFTSSAATSSYYNPPAVRPQARRMGEMSNTMSTRYNGTLRYVCSSGIISVKAERNAGRMYQRLIDKSTGSSRIVTCDFNYMCDVHKTQKILRTDRYYSQQLNADGSMFSGQPEKFDGRWHLRKNGIYAYNTFAKSTDGRVYWYDIYGRRYDSTGILAAYGRKYYMSPHRLSGWKTINGRRYYLMDRTCSGYTASKEGMIMTGFQTLNGKKYYFMDSKCATYMPDDYGRRVDGFFTVNGRTYYGANSKMTGYKDNILGVIQKGWCTISGRRYYLDNGVVRRGWKTIDGHRYYLPNGFAVVNRFMDIDGKRYRFDALGAVKTGLFAVSGKKYYADGSGALRKGLVPIDGKTYLFGEDYAMITSEGWHEVGGTKYYVDENGQAGTEQPVSRTARSAAAADRNTRVHYDENGNVIVGWHELDGKTYYAFEDGTLASGRVEIDGKTYIFDEEEYYLISEEPEEESYDDEDVPDVPETGVEEADTAGTEETAAEEAEAEEAGTETDFEQDEDRTAEMEEEEKEEAAEGGSTEQEIADDAGPAEDAGGDVPAEETENTANMDVQEEPE